MNIKIHLLTGSVLLSGISYARGATGIPWLVYLVEAITTEEDGSRFRLDLNWRF